MNYVVYTDLDGTLLDHDSYSYQAALPALARLVDLDIPVVPVTSKTRAELEPLCTELKLQTPFIVENGAAVFLPKNYAVETEEQQSEAGVELSSCGCYWVKAFAPSMPYWLQLIEQLQQLQPNTFVAMHSMSVAEMVELTSLSTVAAERALTREYSDPLHWFGNDEQLQQLSDYCAQQDVQVVKGGRFVHLLKDTDKGMALRWLNDYLSEFMQQADLESIALGDGENDLSMLRQADIAVQVRSPVHEFPELEKTALYRTERFGPEGWAEAITKILNSSAKQSYS
ncbi:HAD-IIB family hydrolase [Reinekea thalattae]|uniref:HAD-IIB family hydrolase n=1 Tax=Reinekea thalattae TaxID=2593301 RepID=A0A5C8Z761_9GAMM|nr:HAD-IIB family hydrolase [Reinekea thalattae]TXR53133.1 HAD-IIB family hydrolase [Reinekea thalattae]